MKRKNCQFSLRFTSKLPTVIQAAKEMNSINSREAVIAMWSSTLCYISPCSAAVAFDANMLLQCAAFISRKMFTNSQSSMRENSSFKCSGRVSKVFINAFFLSSISHKYFRLSILLQKLPFSLSTAFRVSNAKLRQRKKYVAIKKCLQDSLKDILAYKTIWVMEVLLCI